MTKIVIFYLIMAIFMQYISDKSNYICQINL